MKVKITAVVIDDDGTEHSSIDQVYDAALVVGATLGREDAVEEDYDVMLMQYAATAGELIGVYGSVLTRVQKDPPLATALMQQLSDGAVSQVGGALSKFPLNHHPNKEN